MWDKPNISRIRLLLEDLLLNRWWNLSMGDQNFLMDIFSIDLRIHIKEHLNIMSHIKNIDKIEVFIMDVFDKVHFRVRTQYEKKNILFAIKQIFTEYNGIQQVSPKVLQKALEKKYAGKIILSFSQWETLYAIVKSNDNQHYLIDINNNKIAQYCGDDLEKSYIFSENKIFVFKQPIIKSKEQIKMLIEQFILISKEGTLQAFFLFLKEQCNVNYEEWTKERFNTLNNEVQMADIYEQKWEIFSVLVQQLLHYGNVATGNKVIFTLNTQGSFECLGTWKSIEKPILLKDTYKNLPGIQLPVLDQNDKKHLLITNGIQHDTFDLE